MTPTEYDWHDVYTSAVEQFGGDTPSAQLEADLLDVFQQRPEDITNAIDKIGSAYRQGKVQSPWGALNSELARMRNRPHLVVASGKQTSKRIKNAEQWIRNAGLYCIGWDDCRDSLIEDLHLDEAQADTLKPLYLEQQPIGRQLEQDAIQRGQKWIADQARLEQARQDTKAELDARQTPAETLAATGDFA